MLRRLNTKKRGLLALQKLAIWLLTLFAFFFIALLIKNIISSSGPLQSEIICHDSLALKAKTTVSVGPQTIVSSPALCTTINKEISASKKDEAMDQFSRAMERCWWIWLEGRVNEVFGPQGVFGKDDKTKCFVCNTLVYQKGPTFTKTDLLLHLAELKSKYQKSDILSYIQDRGYVGVYEDAFTPGEVYALVFASNIDENIWKSSFGRIEGFGIPYNENGLWLLKLNRFDKQQPCYYQPDIAGE